MINPPLGMILQVVSVKHVLRSLFAFDSCLSHCGRLKQHLSTHRSLIYSSSSTFAVDLQNDQFGSGAVMVWRNTSLRTEQTSISYQQVTWPYNGAVSLGFLPVYDNACTVSWVTKALLMFTGLLVPVARPDFNLGHQAHNIKIAIETPPSLTVAQVTGLLVQFQSAPTPTNSGIYISSAFISAQFIISLMAPVVRVWM